MTNDVQTAVHPRAPISRRVILTSFAAAAAFQALPLRAREAAPGTNGRPLIASVNSVNLEGIYPGHVQGVCSNNHDLLYWSMTSAIVMTDASGAVLKKVYADTHQGDLCYVDGKIYVAVNLGVFNDAQKRADSWVYVYDAQDLRLLAKHRVPEVVFGAGGMGYANGRFLVVGGLPDGFQENRLYEYDQDFRLIREIALKSGWTSLGIQTAAYNADHWWFGCYGSPQVLLRADKFFKNVQKFVYNGSVGLLPVDRETFLIGDSVCSSTTGCGARLTAIKLDDWISRGLLKPI